MEALAQGTDLKHSRLLTGLRNYLMCCCPQLLSALWMDSMMGKCLHAFLAVAVIVNEGGIPLIPVPVPSAHAICFVASQAAAVGERRPSRLVLPCKVVLSTRGHAAEAFRLLSLLSTVECGPWCPTLSVFSGLALLLVI